MRLGSVRGLDPDAVLVARHFQDVGPAVDVDAVSTHFVRDQAARLVVEPAQDLRAAVELRDLGPEPVEDARELAGDIAAADHEDPFGQRVQVEHLVGRDRQFRPRNVRLHRPTAGGDQDVLGGDPFPGRQLDGVCIGQPGPRVVGRDARAGQQLAIDAFQPVQLGLEGGAEFRPVQHRVVQLPAIRPGVLNCAGIGRGKDHQLFRNAAPDHAGAAIPVLFGQRDPGAGLARRHAGRTHAAGTAADDEEVIVEIAHAGPLMKSRPIDHSRTPIARAVRPACRRREHASSGVGGGAIPCSPSPGRAEPLGPSGGGHPRSPLS